MTKFKNNLLKIFFIFFSIIFFIIYIGTFIQKLKYPIQLNKATYIIGGFFILVIWVILYKLINKYYDCLNEKQEVFLLMMISLLFIFISTMIMLSLKIYPQWDFEIVYEQAKSFVLTGSRLNGSTSSLYFQYHANNIGLFVLFIIIFKIVNIIGITDFLTTATILNCFCINISIFLMYLIMKKLTNKKIAFFSLIICLFFLPLFFYIPIFYTDSISIPYIMLILYIYTKFNGQFNLSKKNIFYFISIILIAFLGMKIKMTVLIVFIACIIHFILNNKIKNSLIILVLTGILISGSNVLWTKFIVQNKKLEIVVNDYGSIPWTHYLMMGTEINNGPENNMRVIGGYNASDFEYTLSAKTSKESKELNKKEYVKRVKEYGFFGYIHYIIKKELNSWGEGAFFSDFLYQYYSSKDNYLMQCIKGSNNKKWVLYFEQSVDEAMLIIFSLFGIMIIKRKKINYKDSSIIIPITIIGMFCVLIIWENTPRYLFNHIPFFIMLICLYFYYQNKENKKKEKV